ncbi:MAG: hypothetical protein ACH34X_10660 [Thiolinea sp.]|jgi:hypothetical protein
MMNTNNLKKMRGAVDPLTLGLLFSALITVVGLNTNATLQQAEAKQSDTLLRKANFTQQVQQPCQTACKVVKQ